MIDLHPLISKRLPLSRWEEAFQSVLEDVREAANATSVSVAVGAEGSVAVTLADDPDAG